MPFLRRTNGDQRGQCIELSVDEFLIGRAPDCHLVLDPQGVSRHHARLYLVDARYVLEDLRSRNTTKLNDQILSPEKKHILVPGDRLSICDVEFEFLNRMPAKDLSGQVIVDESAEEATIATIDATSSSTYTSRVPPEIKLQAILDITRKLSSELEIDAVAPKVLDTLFDLFPMSERAFLILRDPAAPDRLIRKAFKYRPTRGQAGRPAAFGGSAAPVDEAPMSISRSIVKHVLERKQAVLSQDAGNDQNLPVSASIADLKIRSVMCAPLLTPDGNALGIIQLDTTSARQFSQDDLDLLVAVASQSAISVQNARMHEEVLGQARVKRDLKLAEEVQRSFLPRSVPKPAGYQFFAYYHAAYNVGGDSYDFVPLPGDRIAISIADVSGKGVSAALLMAKSRGDTRYCTLTESSPGTAVSRLNQLLCEADLDERFITMGLGFLDLASGKLTVASAGHPPLLIRRAAGQFEEVGNDISGFMLGIFPDTQYDQTSVQLEVGDVVVMYSDGVTDAQNLAGDLYHTIDNPRLYRRVAESAGGPEATGRAILQEVREFSAGAVQADDITLVCFGRV